MSQNADESDLKEDYPSQLRDSLRCQIILKLVLRLPRLTVIPRTVFEHMPLLEVLDLSSTSIQSLPSSVSSLSSLKELILRDCSFLIELPIEIGMLTKLKLLDIEGSEIMYIPKEIVELTDLEVLRLCLSQYAEYYIKAKNVNGGVIVPRMMISKLKKLKELCISVCQEAEWWEKEIKETQDETCHLENLEFLKWYLPTDTTLKQFLDIQINRKPAYEKLSNFTFTIGQHAQLTSCLPRCLEKKFAEFKKCLKWINAEGNIYDISKVMTRAKALFLSRHWTIVNLSAFDISKLKYLLLAECNEMETLVKIDDLPQVVENNNKGGLESLEYLSIHYMEKLKTIWEGPIGKDSLSRLRILALHTCLELTTIFTARIAQNLSCLAELTVEECPKVRSLISTPQSEHGPLFPSLERIFLIDLPELDHIFGGPIVLEKLESLMIYKCVKLQRLTEMVLPRIQKIKGENKWWNSLNAYAPTWENVFEPLKEKSKLIKQLLEATNSLQHFHDVVSREAKDKKPLDGPGLGAQETKADSFNFPLRKEEGRFHTLPEAKDKKPLDGPGLRAKKRKADSDIFPLSLPLTEEEDRSHTLPDEVITNILCRLPLQDAVRTSILSSFWKSKWTMLNQLVFDEKFFRFLKERKHEKHYGRIIYGILHRLKGTITKFVLYMPFDSIADFQDVNNWVEYLSRKGIKEFTLENMNATPLDLPSHLFSCRELEHLKLYNCYLCPKSIFQGFPSLLCLDLSEVVFDGYTCGELISRCPSLEILKLRSNTGGKIKRDDLAKLGNLKVLFLQLRELVNKEMKITSSDIFQIIGLFPKLQELNLNFWKRKLSADAEMSILTALPYVKTLRLYEVDLSNEIMLSCVIDLLMAFSNLESLLIKAVYKDGDPALAVSSSKAYFSKLGQLHPLAVSSSKAYFSKLGLLHLREVKFVLISCTENEVCLLKSLLACSPALKKMVIVPESSEMFGGDDGERKFVTELMQHKASPGAKIVYESSGDATTSHD